MMIMTEISKLYYMHDIAEHTNYRQLAHGTCTMYYT